MKRLLSLSVSMAVLLSVLCDCSPGQSPTNTPLPTAVSASADETSMVSKAYSLTDAETNIATQYTASLTLPSPPVAPTMTVNGVAQNATISATGPYADFTVYIVRWGDTLYSIARRYGTTVEAIAALNGIVNSWRIYAGQRLVIPSKTVYIVKRGDTLYSIARRYGMTVEAIAALNGIVAPWRIYAGQPLYIPDIVGPIVEPTVEPTEEPIVGPTVEPTVEPMLDLSYPPFNAICTDAEIEQYATNLAQSEFARYALPACGIKAIPTLISLVEDESSNMQCFAARALADMGEEAEAAIPALTALWKSDQCTNPYFYLVRIGKAAIPVFIEALKDPNKDIRIGAAIGLEYIGEDARDAVPALIEAANQEESAYYYEAMVESLGAIGTDADIVVPALIKLYEEKESDAAISALAKFGPDARDAIPQLERAFADAQTRDEASLALGSIGRDAVPSLILFLKNNDADVRAGAAFGLVLVGEDAEGAVNDLRIAVEDQEPEVRSIAAVALAQIDPAYSQSSLAETIVFFKGWCTTEGSEIQTRAVQLLGQLGGDAIDAVPTLVEYIDGVNIDGTGGCAEAYLNAIVALGKIGEATQDVRIKEAVPPLVRILDSKRGPGNIQLRAEAALALGKIGQEVDTIIPALIRASGDIDKEVRYNAYIALGMLNVDVHDLILELRAGLDDENVDIRRQAALSLATLGPHAVSTLLTALDDDSQLVQMGAAYALGNMEFFNPEIIAALQAIVMDEQNDLELRRVAASSLELFGQDMQPFFSRYPDTISPENAVCPPIYFGPNHAVFEYDVLTGKCQWYWQTYFTALGEMLIEALCRLFGC